jgi:hypothetical protein
METDKILAVVNQLTVVNQENREVVKFKPTVLGEENALALALQQNKIVKSTVEDITQVLRWVMLKVGVREKQLPSKEEKEVLIEHILTNYGNHTPNEIKLAFDMAILGKLEDVNGRGEPIDLDVNCYGDFSCLYFSKVMNAYRRWARQTFKQFQMEQQPIIDEEREPIDMIEWIEEYRKSENINRELIPLCFYDFLSETTLEVSKEMKWEAMAKSSQSIKSEILMNATEKPSVDNARELKEFELGEKEGFTGILKERILNRAKRMIVYDYLTKK